MCPIRVGVKTFPFKIESDVSAVLVRNRRAKVVNQSFSVEMLGCIGHWGGHPLTFFKKTLKEIRNNMTFGQSLQTFDYCSVMYELYL